jgi:photosystem II oxygen-evolving enhancer protein 1
MTKMTFQTCLLFVFLFVGLSNGFNIKFKTHVTFIKRVIATGIAGAFATGSFDAPASAITRSEVQSLSYLQVKGTGLANRCFDVEGSDTISVSDGKYKIVDMCIEPKTWEIEEVVEKKKGEFKKQYVPAKLMTRQTYTLSNIVGPIVNEGGRLVFTEKDGIDYAATTIQTPRGERVPLLFSVKNLVATGNSDSIKPGFEMGGTFTVPSYRTGLFLDPKGRGGTTGYDMAVALPGKQTGLEGDKELRKENDKTFLLMNGDIEFAVNHVNAEEKEFDGVFVASQPSDTDMGAKTPKNVILKGRFYGRVEKEQ